MAVRQHSQLLAACENERELPCCATPLMNDDRLALYKRLLLSWNEKINLIGPEAKANLDEHIDEALAAAACLKPAGDVLDFGSGGGLPAIPMAIVSPMARFHLVEAEQKKWVFLKHVVRECELNAVVYGDRLDLALTRFPPATRFSLITSRAVGMPETWLPSLRPWMAEEGKAALFQGGRETSAISGFLPEAVWTLPRGDANYLVVLKFHVEHS